MKQKKAYTSTLKWGAILGVMLAIFELVKMYARRVDYAGSKVLDLALIIGFILILYAGIKEFKELYTERLSFAKAFLGCIIISLIGSVILFGYNMLHYAVIEPDGLQKKYEVALDNYRKVIDKDTLTQAELSTYLMDVENLVATEEDNFTWPDTVDAAVKQAAHLGVSKIYSFFNSKVSGKHDVDTADNYRMSRFDNYARRTMVETLSLYLEQNVNEPSTPFVQQIVQNTCSKMSSLNPAEVRYAQNKSHVPHYDKPGRYAAVSALMDLLYGMFFGLFIAMYHYTSKQPIAEEVPDIEADEVDQEDDNK